MICDAPRVYYILTDRYWSLVDRAASRERGRGERGDDRAVQGRWVTVRRAKKRGPTLHTGILPPSFGSRSATRVRVYGDPFRSAERFTAAVQSFSLTFALPNRRFCRARGTQHRLFNDRTHENYISLIVTPL